MFFFSSVHIQKYYVIGSPCLICMKGTYTLVLLNHEWLELSALWHILNYHSWKASLRAEPRCTVQDQAARQAVRTYPWILVLLPVEMYLKVLDVRPDFKHWLGLLAACTRIIDLLLKEKKILLSCIDCIDGINFQFSIHIRLFPIQCIRRSMHTCRTTEGPICMLNDVP